LTSRVALTTLVTLPCDRVIISDLNHAGCQSTLSYVPQECRPRDLHKVPQTSNATSSF